MKTVVITFAAFMLLASCTFRREKNQSEEALQGDETTAPLSFSQAQARVFGPYCVSCHNSANAQYGVSLESYAEVKANLSSIQRTVLGNPPTMPKGSALPQSAALYLDRWLKNGAPETAEEGQLVAQAPVPAATQAVDDAPVWGDAPTSFAIVKEKIFVPRCIECHEKKGGPLFSTYAETKKDLAILAVTTLVDKKMPPGKPLDSLQFSLLKAWFSEGAPEFAEGEGVGQLPEPTFAYLKANLFDSKCLKCHKGAKPKADISFDSLAQLRSSPRQPLKMETDGDPDSSLILLSLINPNEDKRMPPPKSGPRLSEEWIEAVRTWIKNGAPE